MVSFVIDDVRIYGIAFEMLAFCTSMLVIYHISFSFVFTIWKNLSLHLIIRLKLYYLYISNQLIGFQPKNILIYTDKQEFF